MSNPIQDRIRQRLEKIGKTPEAVSKNAGFSRAYLRSLLSRPNGVPNGDKAVALARALETSVAWLLAGEGEEDLNQKGLLREADVQIVAEELISRNYGASLSPSEFAKRLILICKAAAKSQQTLQGSSNSLHLIFDATETILDETVADEDART